MNKKLSSKFIKIQKNKLCKKEFNNIILLKKLSKINLIKIIKSSSIFSLMKPNKL